MSNDLKKLTVYSDGTPKGTVVVDEDGNRLDGVTNVTIDLNAGEIPNMSIEVLMPGVQVAARVTSVNFVCPCCNEALEHSCNGKAIRSTFQSSLPRLLQP